MDSACRPTTHVQSKTGKENTEMQLPTISLDVVSASQKTNGPLRGLSSSALKRSETRYRRFLALILKYPEELLAPARDIDEIWHLHMLHPRAYAEDSLRIFGSILDHDGGFGKANAEELAVLESVFARTAALWQEEFNEEYVGDSSEEMVRCIRACRVACKKVA